MKQPAKVLTIDARGPHPEPLSGHLRMGGQNPQGRTIDVNSRYLLLDGRPWLGVMGEFHFSRYPEKYWDDELLKMKAGGVEIVSTYVFWIHHEEIQGQFDWTGQRNLRRFVELIGRRGLFALIRCGPWAHGECRNGGLPDWILTQCQVRSNDPVYLDHVRRFYGEIAQQLDGLLWKDGGPVIGIQLENEYWAHGEGRGEAHILTLKRIAQEVGLDVPLYTATGWGPVRLPQDEVLPVYGGYPDGFWDREIEGYREEYKVHYFFQHERNDHTIGDDLRAERRVIDNVDRSRYPYLTCEMGGGMHASYHRRPRLSADDIAAMAWVTVGSGGNLQGYYMYHGGSNPEGKLTTLQESQATGYPNDMPIVNYDMQAPLREFGQSNRSYHILRSLHLFLHDFGHDLAPLVSLLPPDGPTRLSDLTSVRWAVRADERHGYLFVNNYQRFAALGEKPDVQFKIELADGPLLIPETGTITIPSGAYFLWPFNMDLGGVLLRYATAEPLCRLEDQDGRPVYVFFAAHGIEAELNFEAQNVSAISCARGVAVKDEKRWIVRDLEPGTGCVIRVESKEGKTITLLVLTHEQALRAWKGEFAGRERLVLSRDDLLFDDGRLRVRTRAENETELLVFPRLGAPLCAAQTSETGESLATSSVGKRRQRDECQGDHCQGDHRQGKFCHEAASSLLAEETSGVFSRYRLVWEPKTASVTCRQVREPKQPPPVTLGPAKVAQVPPEEAYKAAGVWEIELPKDAFGGLSDIYLRFHYVGDIARLYLGGRLVADEFYIGNPWEVGLKRFAPQVLQQPLQLHILPLQKGAPIYLAQEAWPDFRGGRSVARLDRIDVILEREFTLEPAEPA